MFHLLVEENGFLAFKADKVIELRDKTVVLGDIAFEGSKGKVYLYGKSEIKGRVLNGEVIKKNS